MEELAKDMASQPKSVARQIGAAVQAAEERADRQMAAVHETYKQAAEEQQAQIKELLRQVRREVGGSGAEDVAAQGRSHEW